MHKFIVLILCLAVVMVAGCRLVPGTGDTAQDPAAAQNFVPQSISGYNVTDATSIVDALSKAGMSASLVTGNIPAAGAIAKLDNMIQCYKNVGAVEARVYTQSTMTELDVPKVGALAVVNLTRVGRNFLACAVNTDGGASAQSVGQVQPCGGSGTKEVNGETLAYVYAATTPELCSIFQAQFN